MLLTLTFLGYLRGFSVVFCAGQPKTGALFSLLCSVDMWTREGQGRISGAVGGMGYDVVASLATPNDQRQLGV